MTRFPPHDTSYANDVAPTLIDAAFAAHGSRKPVEEATHACAGSSL